MRHTEYNIPNTTNERRVTSDELRMRVGSALILAVVLTSMLAIIGVTFLMVARVNRIATSAISENRELNFAVETVIAKISQELVLDVPRVAGQPDYHDYPGPEDKWLASLEPYDPNGSGTYYWRQISDVTGFLAFNAFPNQNVTVKPVGLSTTVYVREYPKISLGLSGELEEQSADADGDGIADSKWIKLDDITSNKGKTIFAAIRVVDNGGMVNVNTAYKFDPNDPTVTADDIDGSSQMQINLMGLSERDQTHTSQQKIDRLWSFRAGLAPNDVSLYEQNVVWQYGNPTSGYIPFDISDEMKLRNRYLLNYNKITTRIEKLWTNAYDGGPEMPLPTNDYKLTRWFDCTSFSPAAPNDYDYRHISTTYNMDRIINPVGQFLNQGKMVNVNTDGEALLYYAIRAGLYDANVPDPNSLAAQMAVNIVDFRDNDSSVTVYFNPDDGKTYYGFERPCIYISELAHNFVMPDPNDPNTVYRSYAIELYKPYFEDNDPCGWQLDVDGTSIDIGSWPQTKDFYVIQNQDPNGVAILDVNSNSAAVQNSTELVFGGNSQIRLQRFVADVNDYIVVDYRQVPDLVGGWLAEDGNDHSIRRDITLHKCIRRLWSDPLVDSTLGQLNNYIDPDSQMIQAHPANVDFTNIGEIGMIFRRPAYNVPSGVTEPEIRLDLTDLRFQQIFNYLTVFDPTVDGIDNNGDGYGIAPNVDPNELKIPGRININTAPWYVIAQLPWIQYKDSVAHEKAQAISDYRDKLGAYIGRAGEAGFTSIGEMMQVAEIQSLGNDGDDNLYSFLPDRGPDLTDDLARDDFEERDVIFARISNLVTVRSDVFTAYILVRIGTDGPQKRVIAILDRSNVYSSDGKVGIVALHPVPDPR